MSRFKELMRGWMNAISPKLRCWLASGRGKCVAKIGRGAFIHSTVQILGGASVALGDNSVLSEDCWLNVNHRDRNGISIHIGANCFIGRRNFFSSGNRIVLGDFVLTSHGCEFLGSTHIASDPLRPVLSTGTTDTDTITIGANTFIGAGACILGNVRVGHGCVIGARSLVVKDIPAFSQATGNPAIVRKRYSFVRKLWIPVESFGAEDEKALLPEDEYRSILAKHGPLPMPYIAAGGDMGSL